MPASDSRSPTNYTTRVWQTQDGLPQQTVQAVAQTQDGFLWIGTTGGLLRFDGSRFVTFDRANTPAFQEDSVFSLFTARDGTLWIGTEGGGLLRLRGGVFRRFGVPEGLLDGFVRSIFEDRDQKIWIGTDNGLYQLAGGDAERAVRIDGSASIASMAVHALTQAADGTLWAGGSRLVAIRGEVATTYPLVGQYSETRVKSILQTRDGTLWVGTVSGLQRLAPHADRFTRVDGIPGTVRTLCETREGVLWIGTIGQGAYTLHDGHLAAIEAGRSGSPGLPSKTVLSLFEDAERNLWMGTQAGVLRFSRSAVELVSLPDASDSDFETVSRDRDGTLWVASTRLSHLVNGVATPTNFPQLHGARVRNVFRAADDTLWIGTDGRGLFRLHPGQPTRQYTTANGLVNNFVRGVIQTANGDLLIATDEGVSRLASGTFRNFTVQDGLAYFSVRILLQDQAGGIWIGTDRGLSHLVGDSFVEDAATRALSGEKVWALDQTPDGSLWFGTRDNGLYRFVPGTTALAHYTVEQGLASNSIYSILQDRKGRFLIGGANGVELIYIADLERQATDPHLRLSQRFFSAAQGGELSPLYGGTMPAAAIMPNGDAWFPTSKGPVHFLSGQPDSSTPPKVFLDQIVADGRILPVGNRSVELGANNRNLEVSYGSILLGPQDDVQFQYKLEPFDRDWRYGSNRRVADYTNLPAGRYTFHVRAFEGGSGTLSEQTLSVVKHQYFFLTWWFLGCCGIAFAAVVWWIHRQRLHRVETAYKAVIEERARLAREMHDTLIQGCAGVSLLLEAATAEAGGDQPSGNELRPELLELLGYARTQLATSIDEARQAVWNLRGKESAHFGEMLHNLTERLGRSSEVTFECRVKGHAYDFHASAMHEIAMASREAIYNALLHANPSRIEVSATFGQEIFELVVDDNGSGFESTHHAPQGHFGLLGIEERVRRLGGSVRVISAVAMGTSVKIQVPRSAVCFDSRQAEEPTGELVQ
jgi:ligand-binding sensor domain-containing protein/signal transduction histidine kinase